MLVPWMEVNVGQQRDRYVTIKKARSWSCDSFRCCSRPFASADMLLLLGRARHDPTRPPSIIAMT
jgi:hypothetical protein